MIPAPHGAWRGAWCGAWRGVVHHLWCITCTGTWCITCTGTWCSTRCMERSGVEAGWRRGGGGVDAGMLRPAQRGCGAAARLPHTGEKAGRQALSTRLARRPGSQLHVGLAAGDARLATDLPMKGSRVEDPESTIWAEAGAHASGSHRALSGAAAPPECGAPLRADHQPHEPGTSRAVALPGERFSARLAVRACARRRRCNRRRARPCRS